MNSLKFLLLIPLTCGAFANSSECSKATKEIKLNDLIFSLSGNGKLKVSSQRVASTLIVITPHKLRSKSIVSLLLKGLNNQVCNKFEIEVDPTLLCRDSSDNVEPWSYWSYQENENSPKEYSIVSKKSEIDKENAIVKSSRICGFNKISGNVTIDHSNIISNASSKENSSKIITGGSILIEDSNIKGTFTIQNDPAVTTDVNLTRVTIDGNPTIKSNSRPCSV